MVKNSSTGHKARVNPAKNLLRAFTAELHDSMATPTPLTTIFKPPKECLSQLYWSYEGPLQLGPGTECIPPGPSPTSHSYFSPGLYCPENWTVACQSKITSGAITETRAQCCPRAVYIESFSFASFTCNSVDAADSSSYKSWYASLGCTMELGSLATQGYVNVVATGGTPYTTTVSFDSDGGLNAYSVQIAWQASDFAATKTSASSTTATSTEFTTPKATGTSAATNTGARLPGLSQSAKIAIGLIVPVVVISVIVAGLLVSRRKMAKSRHSYGAGRPSASEVPEQQLPPVYEIHDPQRRVELPAREDSRVVRYGGP